MFLHTFKWVCYLCLVLVVGSVVALGVLGSICSNLSTGGISCSSDGAKALAELAFGLLLLTVFTGLPALFAFLGVIFLINEVWVRFGPKRPDGDAATWPALIKHYGKAVLYTFGLFIAVTILGGMLLAGFS